MGNVSEKKRKIKDVANELIDQKLEPLEDCVTPNEALEIPELRECYVFTLDQLAFLDEYKKDLDMTRARKALGLNPGTVSKWLQKTHMKEVVYKIHQCYADAVLMDTKVAAGHFMKLLNKVESRFDEGDSKVAGALANMAGNMLRATGHFGADNSTMTPQVQINIDLSGNNTPEKQPIIDITPK